jgi:octaprenyl-diphosphate synthase
MGIALDEGDLTILKVLSDTTLSMIEGEIIAIEKTGDIQVTRDEALDIIRRKTADLFSAACRLPAHFAPRGDLFAAERLAEYGRCLGVAFQLIDDLLDYTGSEESIGKPVLNDLREGKLTMPLLLALPRASARDREAVATVVREREFRTIEPAEILSIVERHKGIAETRALARDYAGAARVALGSFADSEAKDGLLLATESVIDRVS